MSKRLLTLLSLLLPALAAPLAAQEALPKKPEPPAHTFLWKVEREGLATSHLFGTIHVPDERIHSLHPEVKAALEAADAYFGELEMDDTSELQARLLEAATLPEGKTLTQVLPADLHAEAADAMGKLMLQGLERYKPFMVELTLVQMEMMPDIMAGKEALDARLYKVAKAKGKTVGGIERVEEQIQALALTLTVEEQVESLRKSLRVWREAKERGVSDLTRIKEAWLSGSERYLLELALDNHDFSNPIEKKAYDALLTKRNVVMAERAAKRMREHPEQKHVFAFGAFHFVGPDSVVELLRKDGFTVTRLCAPPAALEEKLLREDPHLKRNRPQDPEE